MPEDSKKQKHKYGKYNNVLLTEEEIKQLREKLPNINEEGNPFLIIYYFKK